TGRPFDAVVCVFGIFFVEDMAAALRSLHDRVAPGGTLAVTTWGADTFEPGDTVFWNAVKGEDASLYKAFNPWDRISTPEGLGALFREAGIDGVRIEPEAVDHPLRSPEDFWTVVLGTGYRATVERLTSEARERVRAACVEGLRRDAVRSIAANVIYATVTKPAGGPRA
ncbi:MAG TPA: ubiquinone biosynthesis protein UbiE, partial [Candidatus Polarisedimenticolia bacterium]|nr:ubiquinone biosynthesis protein UbiE [Candidatus Polarisedimenticolia bacterium]